MDLVKVFETLINGAKYSEEFEGLINVAMLAGRMGLIPVSEARRLCEVIAERS